MPRHGHLGVGHLIQALSLKVSDMQREIAGLRQDVRTLTHLVRELRTETTSQQTEADDCKS